MRSVARGASVLALVGLLAITGIVAGDEQLEEGKPAPELSVGGWKNSKELKLADLKGKVVLIDFWGVW